MARITNVTRRQITVALAGAAFTAGLTRGRLLAQEETDDGATPRLGEVPTTGGARPGPIRGLAVGDQPPAAEPEPELQGVAPVAIQIEKAGVDAVVERVQIVDGVMENPSGPWVVSWYEDLAAPGQQSNTVMAGHVDYWDVGPAVFWNLEQLVPGDLIRIFGEDDTMFEYVVEWMENFVVADLTPEDIGELVGDTEQESLTLITCKIGTFDPATGEYRERFVVRANAPT